MTRLDVLRARAPGWMRRSALRRRVAGSVWWRSAPPRHLKDLTGALGHFPSGVALTFDDGPDPAITPDLLRLLARHEARATFFMCGLAAVRHPDIVRAIADEGHGVGAHGWDHRPVRQLSPREWRRQIARPLDVLADLTDRPVRWFRPPWGAADTATVAALRDRGVTTMLWSSEGLDWHLRDPGEIARCAWKELDRGGVILLHDAAGDLLRDGGGLPADAHIDRRATIRATELLLHLAHRRGARMIGLDDLPPELVPARGRPQLPVG